MLEKSDVELGNGEGNFPLGIKQEDYSQKDKFFFGWAEEVSKNTLKTVQELLGKMLTLITALLAGSVAFLNNMPVTPRAFLISFLIVSLIAILTGLFPLRSRVDLAFIDRDEAENDYSYAVWFRMWCIRIAYVFLVLAFISALVGFLFFSDPSIPVMNKIPKDM